MSTTSRKPVTPPAPKLTRPLAQPQATPKNPITTEIMQRVRRVIRDSRGLITTKTIAEEIDVSPNQMREWTTCWRSFPCADNLVKVMRWLARHDSDFVKEIIEKRSIRFRGTVDNIKLNLSDLDLNDIRSTPDYRGVIADLCKRHDVHHTTIRRIRNGVAAAAPQHPSPAPRSLRRPATE